jgi:hypothetical protein
MLAFSFLFADICIGINRKENSTGNTNWLFTQTEALKSFRFIIPIILE